MHVKEVHANTRQSRLPRHYHGTFPVPGRKGSAYNGLTANAGITYADPPSSPSRDNHKNREGRNGICTELGDTADPGKQLAQMRCIGAELKLLLGARVSLYVYYAFYILIFNDLCICLKSCNPL